MPHWTGLGPAATHRGCCDHWTQGVHENRVTSRSGADPEYCAGRQAGLTWV